MVKTLKGSSRHLPCAATLSSMAGLKYKGSPL